MTSKLIARPGMLLQRTALAALLLLCLGLTQGLQAQQPQATPPQPAAAQREAEPAVQSEGISQKRALELARARFAGNVISINEVRSRNAPMRYRIRMDNEGNIFTVYVDSRNGAITRE